MPRPSKPPRYDHVGRDPAVEIPVVAALDETVELALADIAVFVRGMKTLVEPRGKSSSTSCSAGPKKTNLHYIITSGNAAERVPGDGGLSAA